MTIALAPPIPGNAAKEWISLALIDGLCAQAQLNTAKIRWDDGIDLQVGSTKPLIRGRDPGTIFINLQLKCTSSPDYINKALRFRLKKATYDRLSNPKAVHDQYLVVYVVPPSRPDWIITDPNSCRFQNVPYYLDLRGFPKLPAGKASAVVEIPLANRLTSATLYDALLTEFRKW